jgi:hypothetical protein
MVIGSWLSVTRSTLLIAVLLSTYQNAVLSFQLTGADSGRRPIAATAAATRRRNAVVASTTTARSSVLVVRLDHHDADDNTITTSPSSRRQMLTIAGLGAAWTLIAVRPAVAVEDLDMPSPDEVKKVRTRTRTH